MFYPKKCQHCGLKLKNGDMLISKGYNIFICPYCGCDIELYFKPPIGIKPNKLWMEDRILSVSNTIQRLICDNMLNESVIEWSEELTELLKEYVSRYDK